ncbi:MAG: glycogen debranching enzyme, partial [Vibrio sp.]
MNDLFSTPYPLGATLNSQGCNFAIYAPASSDIQLALFDESGEHYTAYQLQHEYANIKHTCIPDVKEGQLYGFIVTINNKPHYIADPYAQAISAPLNYTPPFDEKTSFTLAKCVVTADQFDWHDSVMPKRPREEMILCETHVKGLTQLHPDVPPRENGTYLGLVSEPMLEFYEQQNINTLQLLPIAACMHEPHLLELD